LIVIKNLENELKSLNIESIEDDIRHEDNIKENYELRKEKLNLKEKLTLNIDNYFLKIKEIEHNINKFKKYESQIEENKEIQININNIDDEILLLNNNVGIEYDEIFDIKKEIAIQEKEIENISLRIDKFVQQKREEELMKEYQRCISRDGIPTYLLKKSIHLINKELNDLLTNVDFTLFFNDNLILKLSMDDRLDVSQNAIESSGKERTFCALTLKIALRQINVKSRPNFIILDEIMGKLYEKSIMEFVELLDEIKKKIDKIIIIEHVHPINYDVIINVKKNSELVSSLFLNK
jgi:DNA repair exonuclease SbcCD ATPase subunit